METTFPVEEFIDSCVTCSHAPVCMYRARRDAGQYCDMFDEYVPTMEGAMTRARPVYSDPIAGRGQAAGLCINCDRRHDCAYSKRAGGIWHCEDYE